MVTAWIGDFAQCRRVLLADASHGEELLDGITETRKGELLKALKALWTHDSTAIEGNTLTLGDTSIVRTAWQTTLDLVAEARG